MNDGEMVDEWVSGGDDEIVDGWVSGELMKGKLVK